MNEDATKVIDAYLDAKKLAIPHAILIEGPWGSGKTHFLEKVYEPQRQKRERARQRHHTPFLFVSMYGVTSAAEAEMRIYKAACPGEAVAGSIAGTLTLGISEFFKVKDTAKAVLDQMAKRAVQRLNDFIFVFDDLERVEEGALGEVMGLVNTFVAQSERRVILIADEEKLKQTHSKSHWDDQNEKVIGRRARIEPDVESVVRTSISKVASEATKAFMIDHLGGLVDVARQSKVENLRSLCWAIHNAGRFVDCLIADADIPGKHIARTMLVVAATTLWYRTGLINDGALRLLPGLSMNLAMRSLSGRKDQQPDDQQTTKAKQFVDTFATLSVASPPVDYDFVSGFEKTGVLDCDRFLIWTKSHFGFGEKYTEPAWRVLWHSQERPIADVDRAIIDLTHELAERKHVARGVILHAAGLAIRLRDAGDTTLTGGEAVSKFFKRYVDELKNARQLEVADPDPFPARFQAYGGLGFHSRETPEFQDLNAHLSQRQNELANAVLQDRIEVIVGEAEAGNWDALSPLMRRDYPSISEKPVLKDLSIDRFASLFTKDNPALDAGGKLLAYRYSTRIRTVCCSKSCPGRGSCMLPS